MAQYTISVDPIGALGPASTADDATCYCSWADGWFARHYPELDVEHVPGTGDIPADVREAEAECFDAWCGEKTRQDNGWSEDVTASDRVIVWGAGSSVVEAIRTAESDLAYATSDARAWIESCGRDDYWVVSLSPADVAAYDLDSDPAVAGYSVVETGC